MNKKENEPSMSKDSEMTRHRCNHTRVLHTYMCMYKKITEWRPWGSGGCGDEGELAGFLPG